MTRYVALSRGINVGEHRRVPMPTLRESLADLGCAEVRAYPRSGNAVFVPPAGGAGPAAWGEALERAIAERLSLDVRVLVPEGAEPCRVAARIPFSGRDIDPARLLVTLLSGPVDHARLADLDPAAYAPDQLHVGEREVHVHCPDGARQSRLTQALREKRPGLFGTARDGNTVRALAAMVTSDEPR
ncbi:DUF1697 domain-containing protein [Streptomyces buecherae]|uniref:DUF1697 domain-containing protein n=1 Tax=Streptomyces buecherae TaxID=2763006 RepID=UPI001C261583|nr:DUF1697 domain-containing protein [Streptomyces buecherae]